MKTKFEYELGTKVYEGGTTVQHFAPHLTILSVSIFLYFFIFFG